MSRLLITAGKLAISALGRLMLDTAECIAACCGGSGPPYRRWCPCDQEGCWPEHPDIWIIDGSAECLDHDTILVTTGVPGADRWCYKRTNDVRPLAFLPIGAVVIPGSAVDCNANPQGCNDPVCNPTGEPGPCPCACESVCATLVFPPPANPGDPPCMICCWGKPMSFTQSRDVIETNVYAPIGGHPFSCTAGIAYCGRREFHERSAGAVPAINCPVCDVSGGCVGCYAMETRSIASDCHGGPVDGDTGWVPSSPQCLGVWPIPAHPVTGAIALTYDSGWVYDFQGQNFGQPIYGRHRDRWQWTCGGFQWIHEEEDHEVYSADGTPNNLCTYDQRIETTTTRAHIGGPNGAECCGGCREQYCGDLASGGGCLPLGTPVGPPEWDGSGPIMPQGEVRAPGGCAGCGGGSGVLVETTL